MASFDYFKKVVDDMERIKAETAHEEHIVEFRAMCAKMINDAIPDIKQQCLEAMRQELKKEEQQKAKQQQRVNVDVQIDEDSVRKKVMDAFHRIFR